MKEALVPPLAGDPAVYSQLESQGIGVSQGLLESEGSWGEPWSPCLFSQRVSELSPSFDPGLGTDSCLTCLSLCQR